MTKEWQSYPRKINFGGEMVDSGMKRGGIRFLSFLLFLPQFHILFTIYFLLRNI